MIVVESFPVYEYIGEKQNKRGTVMMGNLTHAEKLKFEKRPRNGWK